MKKHIFLLMVLCMLVLFVTGCNNNNTELPTFEELAKINRYDEIFKTHSNVFVQTVQKSDIKEEDGTVINNVDLWVDKNGNNENLY